MSFKVKEPVKYCLTCEFHFHAPPEMHEEEYHPDGEWMYIEGSYRDFQ